MKKKWLVGFTEEIEKYELEGIELVDFNNRADSFSSK